MTTATAGSPAATPNPFDTIECPGSSRSSATSRDSARIQDELFHLERTTSNLEHSNLDVAASVDSLCTAVENLTGVMESMQGLLEKLVERMEKLEKEADRQPPEFTPRKRSTHVRS
jgi:uncharacterized coiled-coil protein SlyX